MAKSAADVIKMMKVRHNYLLIALLLINILPAWEDSPEELIKIPEGSFLMGSSKKDLFYELFLCYETAAHCPFWIDKEKLQHQIYLKTYFIDMNEVTFGNYLACVKAGACKAPGQKEPYFDCMEYAKSGDNFPVTCVSWFDAQDYCHWRGKRLPTEAEWEKAARGLDSRRFPWGNKKPTCNEIALSECFLQAPQGPIDPEPIGSRPGGASYYGVMDMGANVTEWVSDWYDSKYYSISSTNNPQGPDKGEMKVCRGGENGDPDVGYLATSRGIASPKFEHFLLGFRCAKDE